MGNKEYRSAHLDLFNLVLGDLIGEGAYRKVFTCRIRPDLVVKVEIPADWRQFHNNLEAQFHADYKDHKVIGPWLAPIRYVSPDARIILMDRCQPIRADELPAKVPACFNDVKPGNFGRLPDGRIVCVDYALTRGNAPSRLAPHGFVAGS